VKQATRRTALAGAMLLAGGARAQPAAGLSRIVAQAGALPRLRTILVARGGLVRVAHAFRRHRLDAPTNIKSASKSVLSALAGIAIGRGVLSGLDQRIAPILGPLVPRDADPRVADITVGHLLSMRAGLERTSGANYGAWTSSRDWIGHVLTRPMEDVPGGRMIYSTGTSHLLSAVLTRAARRSTAELAREWLARPLGISIPPWRRDPQGIFFGGNDMAVSPRDLLTFAELYRNDGTHDGRRVLPAGWVADSFTPRARSPWSGLLHGLGWWVAQAGVHPVYFAWGYGGQMAYVLPDLALSVAVTCDPDGDRDRGHQQAVHALLTDAIIPEIERTAS
jgi:CubicO group peptidase (beta-lactamase class C family)